MGLYVTGLLLDGERKSIEPMAGRLVDSPAEVEAMRQRLQQYVTVSDWSDDELRRRLTLKLDAEMPGAEALVVDDTGFPKKGKASVGVARQYSGTLCRTDNCQVATSLHLASETGSGCIALQLYLPEARANDLPRRNKVGVPETAPGQRPRASPPSSGSRPCPSAPRSRNSSAAPSCAGASLRDHRGCDQVVLGNRISRKPLGPARAGSSPVGPSAA